MPRVGIERVILGYKALLHDIGKAFQRTDIRNTEYAWKLFRYLSLTGNETHETISEKIIDWYLDGLGSGKLEEYIKIADRASASERAGKFTKRVASCINKVIENLVKQSRGMEYKPGIAPLLTPLWLLDIVKDTRGKESSQTDPAETFKKFFSLTKDLSDERNESIHKQYCEKIQKILSPVWQVLISNDSEYWIPVIPLDDGNIIMNRLKLMNYESAHRNSMYSGITERILKYMAVLRLLYKDKRFNLGSLYTLERILSSTLMLVPSGVFGSLFPDIGLYTHSRIVASLADIAYNSGEEKLYQYLLVDLNGIQRFIYSPIREAAASRILRGRSIIVQILSHVITDIVLDEYDAPRYSYVIKEGGTSLLIVKYDKEKEPGFRERIWSRLLRALYEDTQGSLLLTMASSGPIDMEKLSKGTETFVEVYREAFEELEKQITMSKARRDTKLLVEGLLVGQRRIIDSDYVTGEPVYEDDDFKIDADDEEQRNYLEEFAQGKIESGKITGITHMSLVVGSLARNLRKIIVIDTDDPLKLYKMLLANAGIESQRFNRLYISGKTGFCGARTSAGLIPFVNLKKVAILLSASGNQTIKDSTKNLAKILKCLSRIRDQGVPIYKVIIYNISDKKLSLGLPIQQSPELDELSDAVTELEESETTVVFDYMIMSTHHPISVEANISRIKGLDEIAEFSTPKGIIGVAKIDGDGVGDIIRKYSIYGPSRLAMFSDLMNIAFQIIPLLKLEGSRYKENLVFLYGGGDDIVAYGGLASLIKYLGEVYESISSILRPITYTAAIAFDRYKAPILYLYARTSRLLEMGKAAGGGLLVLEHVAKPPPYPIKLERVDDQDRVIDMLPGIPLNKNNEEYRMLMNIIVPREEPENKSLLYRLSSISSALVDAFNMRRSKESKILRKSRELELQALIYYSYIVVRLGGMRCSQNNKKCVYEELEKLRKLGLSNIPDPPWETRNLEEISIKLARLKPVIDTFLLVLRKRE